MCAGSVKEWLHNGLCDYDLGEVNRLMDEYVRDHAGQLHSDVAPTASSTMVSTNSPRVVKKPTNRGTSQPAAKPLVSSLPSNLASGLSCRERSQKITCSYRLALSVRCSLIPATVCDNHATQSRQPVDPPIIMPHEDLFKSLRKLKMGKAVAAVCAPINFIRSNEQAVHLFFGLASCQRRHQAWLCVDRALCRAASFCTVEARPARVGCFPPRQTISANQAHTVQGGTMLAIYLSPLSGRRECCSPCHSSYLRCTTRFLPHQCLGLSCLHSRKKRSSARVHHSPVVMELDHRQHSQDSLSGPINRMNPSLPDTLCG